MMCADSKYVPGRTKSPVVQILNERRNLCQTDELFHWELCLRNPLQAFIFQFFPKVNWFCQLKLNLYCNTLSTDSREYFPPKYKYYLLKPSYLKSQCYMYILKIVSIEVFWSHMKHTKYTVGLYCFVKDHVKLDSWYFKINPDGEIKNPTRHIKRTIYPQ